MSNVHRPTSSTITYIVLVVLQEEEEDVEEQINEKTDPTHFLELDPKTMKVRIWEHRETRNKMAYCLILSQTTNFRLFQAERVCK